MKAPWMPMPWDLFVIFTVTSASFGISIYKIAYQPISPAAPTVWQDSQSSAERKLSARVQSETLDLGCVERKLRQKTVTYRNSVRVKGKFCNLSRSASKEFGRITIRNLTTAAEGTVSFSSSGANFVSEGVSLARGRNLIEVEWTEYEGAPYKSYVAEVIEQ